MEYRKKVFFIIFLAILCSCSSARSSGFDSVVPSSSISPNSSSLSENNSFSYSSSIPISRPPLIKDYNEEEYKPFFYENNFLLKYDDSNNSYIVCGYQEYIKTNGYVEIPEYCNGLPITEIAPYCFRERDEIKTLVVSKNINKVYVTSFPKSRECVVEISKDNQYFSIKNGCLCSKDESELIMMVEDNKQLSISKKVMEINESFWSELSFIQQRLTRIDVEEGNEFFTSVNGLLFNKEMTYLIRRPRYYEGDLYIPKTVKQIDQSVFELGGGTRYKNVFVEEQNPYFSSKDGMLYKGNFEELIYQPIDNETKRLVLPYTVKAISCRLHHLEEIVLSDGLERIQDAAFSDCAFSNVTIYNDCEYLGSQNNKFMCLYKNADLGNPSDSIVAGSVPIHNECKFILQPSKSLYTQNNPCIYVDETGVYSKDKKVVCYYYTDPNENPSIQLLPETEVLQDGYNDLLGQLYNSRITIKVGKNFKDLDRLLSMQKKIRTVEFYEDSNYYLMENGMLLNNDKTVLYRYNGESDQVTIPTTVKKILSYAFLGSNVNKVALNECLEEIGDEAFSMLSEVRDISFPNSLVSIGKLAFFNCRLSTIRLGEKIKYIGPCAFANDYSSISEIYLSSKTAQIDYLAFSRPRDRQNEQLNVAIHLSFDRLISNTELWDDSWCGFYSWVDGENSSDLQSGFVRSYSMTYDSRYLLDWNYSL